MAPRRSAVRATVLVALPTVFSVLVVESVVSPTTAAGAVALGLVVAELPLAGPSD